MPRRRREDQVTPRPGGRRGRAGEAGRFEVLVGGGAPGGPAGGAVLPEMLLLRGAVGEREVVVAGVPIGALAPGRGPGEVARAESAWLEQWARVWKRSQLPERMLAFFGELSEAETEEGVCRAVADHAVRATGGYRAAVLLAAEESEGEEAWREVPRFSRPGLILAAELARLLSLEPAVDEPEIALWAHLPLGGRGVLLLAERRCDRVFDADDWALLEAMATHGARALERVRRLRQAREASLTDPLTGLANRRAMEVLLPRAWAAAERGEGLTLVMLDADRFKEVNDTRGHAVGDQLLRIVADAALYAAKRARAPRPLARTM